MAKIDKSYDELVGAMASAHKDTEAIVAVTQNQHEFNLRKKEWFSTLDNPSSSTAAVPEPSTSAPVLCLPALPGILLDLPGVLLSCLVAPLHE